MKKVADKTMSENVDMKAEYDFLNMKDAVRGKYYKAYRDGHMVTIHKEDSSTVNPVC